MAKINIQCYKCDTIYELEPDMIGETVECAVCGAVFVIPDFDPDGESEIIETNSHINPQQQTAPDEKPQAPAAQETAPIEEQAAPEEDEKFEPPPVYSSKKLSSSTIKLDIDRKGHGMVPVVDDQFGLKKSHNPRHPEEKKEEPPPDTDAPAEPDPEAPGGKWWKMRNKK